MGRSIFFEKNLRIQFDVVFDTESNGGIFDCLAPFVGELWRFENLKFVQNLQPTQKFLKIFLSHDQKCGEFFKFLPKIILDHCTCENR